MGSTVTIDQSRMEAALDFLWNSDEEVARLKTEVRRKEYLLKRKEAHAFLSQPEGSVKDRECRARVDTGVTEAYDKHTDAMEAFERLAARRETEALVIELYRTIESSRRMGKI